MAGEYRGVIGRDFGESEPWWPDRVRAPQGAPNVLVVILDDVGFAQIGCFGSDIATPHLDALAGDGLRYTNFHTTALCSPTRSCVITGRNHHSNGMGRVVELATGFPGYNATIPFENGFLSEMLLPHGYATFAVGKWHLTPDDECHAAATRKRWPLGRGFERFYGFMEGETHQFSPALVCDNRQIAPPRSYEEGYHLTEDLVDQATAMVRDLRSVDVDKPFLLYFATGACHAPHQAPPQWIERYKGAFDGGWDAWRDATIERQKAQGIMPAHAELSPRPDWVPAWETLSADEQRLYARYMEAFAGFLSHTDAQLGRLLDFLRDMGELDNTLVFVLSDNGASSEGGPTGSVNDGRLWNMAPRTVEEAVARLDEIGGPLCHNNYPWGWTVAGNTPFKRWKREVHEGGVADPLIVRFPGGGAVGGGFRRQYVHAVDITPTVLSVLGVPAPSSIGGVSQSAVEGVSFSQTFSGGAVGQGEPTRHHTQYYEMFGCRALYHDGWKAVTFHPIQDTRQGFDEDTWELYDTEADPSECHDLAPSEPERLQQMIDRWWIEAGRYQVLPLDNRPFSAFVFERPRAVPPRGRYRYFPDRTPVPEQVAVNVRNRDHVVRVRLEVSGSGTGGGGAPEGVLMSQGSGLGGWALFIQDGHLVYVHNYVSLDEHRIASTEPVALGPGEHELAYAFRRTADHRGVGRVVLDGVVVGTGEIPRFTPVRFSTTGAGLTVGYSEGLPVSRSYEAPFRLRGATITDAVVEVDGEAFVDPEGEVHVALSMQ